MLKSAPRPVSQTRQTLTRSPVGSCVVVTLSVDGYQRNSPASQQNRVASPSADTRRAVRLSRPPFDRQPRQTIKCLHVLSSFQRTGSPRPKALAAPLSSGEPSNLIKPREPCQHLFGAPAKLSSHGTPPAPKLAGGRSRRSTATPRPLRSQPLSDTPSLEDRLQSGSPSYDPDGRHVNTM